MTVLTKRFRLRGVHSLFDRNHQEPRHGHEYWLEVSWKSPSMAVNELSTLVNTLIVDPWDARNWANKNLLQASGELLVEEFDRLLRESEAGSFLMGVQLQETSKNKFISSNSNSIYCD